MDCPNCGGIMVSTGSGYRCRFCGHQSAPAPSSSNQSSYSSQQNNRVPVQTKGNMGATVYENNINGVAEITCVFPQAKSAGSGYLINNQGYLITNTHVVTYNCAPCNNITVRMAGEEVRARIVALGDDKGGHGNGVDLALLKLDRIPRKAKALAIADFNTVKIGESVFVIGNSLGYGSCITGGIVSDKKRNVNGKMLLMTDCAINSGNSGGPIFNENGKVIGTIVSAITSAKGMNFAIPADTVVNFLNVNRMRV